MSPNSQAMSSYSLASLSELWPLLSERYGDRLALWDPHAQPEVTVSYRQLNESIHQFAAGLMALGVAPGDRIAIVADNSPRWLVADQGCLMAGAVNVPRSANAPVSELAYILQHSESTALVVEDVATLKRIQAAIVPLPMRVTILISDEQHEGCLNFSELLRNGTSPPDQLPALSQDRLATLMYTSGTTGEPKGVMLSHGNLLHQVNAIAPVLHPDVGDRFLTILPTWHCYERSCEYFILSQGSTLVYTAPRYIKQDLQQYTPHCMVAVPRIWETMYEGIQRQFREKSPFQRRLIAVCLNASERWVKLGRQLRGRSLESDPLPPLGTVWGRCLYALLTPVHRLGDALVYRKVRQAVGPNFKFAVSGGGSLASHLDTFYEIVGIEILVGYGLTETSPVLSVRPPERNVRGTAGFPLPEVELQIRHPDTLALLPQGKRISEAKQLQGLVMAKGPQVMLGYYKNPEATTKVLDGNGWLNTGDLGWLTPDGQIVLTGRAKDTIVLTNGENVEPQPLEDAGTQSPYIDCMVVVGQDRKRLAALVYPNVPALQQQFHSELTTGGHLPTSGEGLETGMPDPEVAEYLLNLPSVRAFVLEDLQRRIAARPEFRPDEQVGDLRFVSEAFSMENGLMTQTYKIRRNRVVERYAPLIADMYR
jgi:long-chain acyl-CoA synthetase